MAGNGQFLTAGNPSGSVGTTAIPGVSPQFMRADAAPALAVGVFNAIAPSQTGNAGLFLTTNGSATSWAAAGGASGANPSGTIGLSQVNGVATTFMRSDGMPALSQSITPTWTGAHNFAFAAVACLIVLATG